jgi:hypothetical protein
MAVVELLVVVLQMKMLQRLGPLGMIPGIGKQNAADIP